MEGSSRSKLTMYLAVKAVCDAKPSVWQQSEAFEDALTDFCACIDNIIRLQPAGGIAVEMAVADKILTTDMDELIEQFEAVDVIFVEDYTAARSMNLAGKDTALVPLLTL
jgi:hypothetical protein